MIEESIIPFEVVSKETGKTIDLAMQSLVLTGRIIPIGAYLLVEHSFVCNEKKPVEVIYSFGLPREATLRRLKSRGKIFSLNLNLSQEKKLIEFTKTLLKKDTLQLKLKGTETE